MGNILVQDEVKVNIVNQIWCRLVILPELGQGVMNWTLALLSLDLIIIG